MEKIRLEWQGDDRFSITGGRSCGEMSPKELMLLALGLCAGKTTAALLLKMRAVVSDFEVEARGRLTDEQNTAQSPFASFSLGFYARTTDRTAHAKIEKAVTMTHEKYCAVTLMMRRIAPVAASLHINGVKVLERA